MPSSSLVTAVAFALKVNVVCSPSSIVCAGDPRFCIPIGRAAWLNEAHSSLPLHCLAGSWCARDHPVPDPVCQNCKGLYQQDSRHRTNYCALQVCAVAKGQRHRAYPWKDPRYWSLLGHGQPWEPNRQLIGLSPNTSEQRSQDMCTCPQPHPGDVPKIILREPLNLCGTAGEHWRCRQLPLLISFSILKLPICCCCRATSKSQRSVLKR